MNKLQLTLTALAAAGTLSLSTMAPASADSAASTRNIILGVAALAGIAIESNVARKNAQAGSLAGYLPDGSAVYGDGHVVGRNGYSYFPGNNGQSVSCANGRCAIAYNNNARAYNGGNAYGGRVYNGNPNGSSPYSGYSGNRNNGNNDYSADRNNGYSGNYANNGYWDGDRR